MDDLTKQIQREVWIDIRAGADPVLRIGDQRLPAGYPHHVDAYRALLAVAVRLVESRAKAAPEKALKPVLTEWRPLYGEPRDRALYVAGREAPGDHVVLAREDGEWRVYDIDDNRIGAGSALNLAAAQAAADAWIRANPDRVPYRLPDEAPVDCPPCPETCETEIDRLADRVLRGHRDTVSPEVAERVRQRVRERVEGVRGWLGEYTHGLTAKQIEECARAGYTVMADRRPSTAGPWGPDLVEDAKQIIAEHAKGEGEHDWATDFRDAVLARAAELRKERP